ncbi:hypothetical protein ACH5RR_037179 [Cinchona calisaya]|uniref:Uncharacterized protein n=1 Tax=Cinchona calisaya TaxID=153742 RepID=A0ABD2Y6V7_9GENT
MAVCRNLYLIFLLTFLVIFLLDRKVYAEDNALNTEQTTKCNDENHESCEAPPTNKISCKKDGGCSISSTQNKGVSNGNNQGNDDNHDDDSSNSVTEGDDLQAEVFVLGH